MTVDWARHAAKLGERLERIMRGPMQSWERNVLGIADWTDPKWKLRGLLKHVLSPGAPEGAIVELGVYKGKCLLALAQAFPDRKIWGYDSWSGLPEFSPEDEMWELLDLSDEHRRAIDRMHYLSPGRAKARKFDDASLEDIQRRAELADIPADQITYVTGWPPDCSGPVSIAAASLDCDLYQSYQDALPWVWERLVPGGYIHLDEYYSLKYPGPRIAVDEFVAEHGLGHCLHMHPRISGEFERWYLVKK